MTAEHNANVAIKCSNLIGKCNYQLNHSNINLLSHFLFLDMNSTKFTIYPHKSQILMKLRNIIFNIFCCVTSYDIDLHYIMVAIFDGLQGIEKPDW